MYEMNLTRIYQNYHSEEYQADLKALHINVALMESMTKNFTTGVFDENKVQDFIMTDDETEDLINKLYNYSMLLMAKDVSATDPRKEMSKLYAMMPILSQTDIEFTDYLFSIEDLRDQLQKTEYLKEHTFVILEKRDIKKHQLSKVLNDFNETVTLPNVRILEQLYHQTYQSKLVSYQEKEMTLTELEKFCKGDYKARTIFDKGLEDISSTLAIALIGIKRYTAEISKCKGYSSVLQMSTEQTRLTGDTLNKMFVALEEFLPKLHEYLRRKAILLQKETLSWDDLSNETKNKVCTYSIEETKVIIVDALGEICLAFQEHVIKVFDQNWVDWNSSTLKQKGAFCTNIRAIKESRIIINFDGTVNSVIELAHELGHSYHGDVLFSQTTSNSKLKLNTGETSSILFENIVVDYLFKNAKNRTQKIEVLEYNLHMYTGILLEVYSRFIFEKELFKKVEGIPLNAHDLNGIMKNAIQTVFKDTLTENTIQDKVWMMKHHYFSSVISYYNWHYIFGLLFSKGIQTSLLTKENNINQFNNLLSRTGKETTEDLAHFANINLNEIDFWRKSLSSIEQDIKAYMELTK